MMVAGLQAALARLLARIIVLVYSEEKGVPIRLRQIPTTYRLLHTSILRQQLVRGGHSTKQGSVA